MCASQTTFGAQDDSKSLNLKVIGIGGAGCNFVSNSRLPSIAIGSNSHDLERCRNSEKIVISKKEIAGFAETHPSVLSPSIIPKSIREIFEDIDIAVIVAGLGGETGSNGLRLLSNVAEILGKTTIFLVSMPFSVESEKRRTAAYGTLEYLKTRKEIIICFENDGLRKLVPDMPFDKAFSILNAIMDRPVIDISKAMTSSDIAQFKQIAESSDIFHLGVGLGGGRMRDSIAIREAFESPWLNFNQEGVQSGIVILSSNPIESGEFEDVGKQLRQRMPNANLMMKSYEDKSLENRLRITLMSGHLSPLME